MNKLSRYAGLRRYLVSIGCNAVIAATTALSPTNSLETQTLNIESAIKKRIFAELYKERQTVALGRSPSGFYYQGLCQARGENYECCNGEDYSCQAPDRSCFCDKGCQLRNDCCQDYGSFCGSKAAKACNGTVPIGIISGDPHYQSFDGRSLHFQGKCGYYISKLCSKELENPAKSIKYYEISAWNEPREDTGPNATWTREVQLKFQLPSGFGYTVKILKGRMANVNGVMVDPPYITPYFTIVRSGRFLEIGTNFDVKLLFDGQGTAKVQVGCQYESLTCGLMGNGNGDPNDDFLSPDGTLLANNKKAYGDSWLLDSEDSDQCDSPEPECTDQQILAAFLKCKALREAPFNACHSKVAYAEALENCIYDVCVSGESRLKCDHFQVYADACQDNGVNFIWRNATRCPMNCGENEIYRSCGCDSSCVEMCDERQCTEGCFCKAGFVRSADGNCVEVSNCNCENFGSKFKLWETITTVDCAQQCTCINPIGNQQQCVDYGCASHQTCRISGMGTYECTDTGLPCAIKGPHAGPPQPDWIPPDSCCGDRPYSSQIRGCCGENRLYTLGKKECCDGSLQSSPCGALR